MKRWIWRALVFLLLGAVINVAVAWWCVVWVPASSPGKTSVAPAGLPIVPADWGSPLVFEMHPGRGRTVFFVHWLYYLAPDGGAIKWERERAELAELQGHFEQVKKRLQEGQELRQSGGDQDIGDLMAANDSRRLTRRAHCEIVVSRTGLPFEAMEYITVSNSAQGPGVPSATGLPVAAEGLVLGPPDAAAATDQRRLPLRPIWPGFTLNFLLYSMACAAMWSGARGMRSWWRLSRGLCVHCAYPTGPSPACTECGNPVKPRTAVPT
jgi:hypothetical protein